MTTTKPNWSAMSARERDALVAVQVMGWTPHPTLAKNGYWRLPETRAANLKLLGTEAGPWDYAHPPFFTTDIASAFHVIDKLRAEGFAFRLSWTDYDQCEAVFRDVEEAFFGQAATIAEAIAIAALCAKGIDV